MALLTGLLAFCHGGMLQAADCDALADQTIRWVVPSKPGGGYDAYSRLIQPFLERQLAARIVIENRPEAGGIVGAVAIRDARKDGRTIGIINASGLLAAHLAGRNTVPDPSADFTILARIVTNRMVLFTGQNSGIPDIESLLRKSNETPIVVGVRDAGSASFFAFPIAAQYLGLDYWMVTGYVGSTSRVLAVLRGEVDVILQTLDSVMPYVNSGELLPLLWVTGAPEVGQQALSSPVPTLDDLERVVLAPVAMKSPAAASGQKIEADAVSALMRAGRLVVAPSHLPAPVEACLQSSVLAVLQSVDIQQTASEADLTLEPADAGAARADVEASKQQMRPYVPLVRAAIDRANQ